MKEFVFMDANEKEKLKKLRQRIESGEVADQPCWSCIRQLNSYSEEQLDSVAIRDGYRTYTYRQMFRYWERYAEAFSGLGLTGGNNSRVALISTPITESIFAFYGLNMTGASVSLIYHFDLYDEKQISSMIEREKITDIIVSELFAFPQLMKRLIRDRDLYGIRNIIVLSSPMGGDYAFPALEVMRCMNRDLFKEIPGGHHMDDLLKEYDAHPISYGKGMTDIVLHTTGTVSGMHKPVPMTDRAMNSFVVSALKAKDTYPDFKKAPKHMITYLTLNMAWVYAMMDMLHTPLGLGMEIVALPVGATNPRYSEAIQHYGINVLFTSMGILDTWLKTMPDIDLSKLKVVFLGGTYVSPDYKKKFNDYLKACGSTARIINGYGLSELGGACVLAPSDREDDAIGFLLPGFNAKIYVEDEKKYYDIADGPRTGLLLLNSPTMSTGKLGDTVFFKLENVDGADYFNTNDLVRINDDGSLTCIGRSNQFFVNNAGVRFDAGLVQTAITSQPGVRACGLAPEFHKTLHDNIPVLYVEMDNQGVGDVGNLRKALIQVFITDGMLEDSNMPSQCVFVEKMPLNSSGKVDAKKLASGTVTGDRYSVKPVKVDGRVIDIMLVPAAEGESATVGAGVPEELENDPYNILNEVFAAIPDITQGRYSKIFKIPGLRELIIKLTDFDINNIPQSMWNSAPKMFDLAYKKLMPFMKGVDKMSKKNKWNQFNGFMPMFQGMMPMPPVPPMPMPWPVPFVPASGNYEWPVPKKSSTDAAKTMDEFESNLLTFWDQIIDMQKSAIETSRDQWEQFFDQMMEMQDTFIDSLPKEAPSVPGLPTAPVTPQEAMEKVKDFQELAKDHVKEQADSYADFVIKRQEKTLEVVNEVVDKVSEQRQEIAKEAEEAKEAAEEAKEEAAAEEAPKEKAPKEKAPKEKAPKAEKK